MVLNTQSTTTEIHSRYLLYGNYGCGKTYMLGIIDDILKKLGTKGLYIFDFDHGIKTLSTAGFSVDYDRYVDFVPKKPHAFNDFKNRFTDFESDTHGYGGLAIDSLTTLERVLGYEVLNENVTTRKDAGRLGKKFTLNDFGLLIEIMHQLLSQLINVSHHMDVFVTAHLKERQNPISDAMEFVPAITGKALPSSIGLWFNEVWHIYSMKRKIEESKKKDETEILRVAQTVSGDRYSCKTQTAGLPPHVEVSRALRESLEDVWSKFSPTINTQ